MASGNVGGSWTSIDMTPSNMTTNAGFVPSGLSNLCYGCIETGGNSNVGITNDNSVSATLTTAAPNRYQINVGGGTAGIHWRFNLKTADTLYWQSNGSGGNVYLHGFEINKLT